MVKSSMKVHYNLEKSNLTSTRKKDHLITLILPIPFNRIEPKAVKLTAKTAPIFPMRR